MSRWQETDLSLLWGLKLIMLYGKVTLFCFFFFKDILDEMRKELSKLKEELIDGNYHCSLCSLFTHTQAIRQRDSKPVRHLSSSESIHQTLNKAIEHSSSFLAFLPSTGHCLDNFDLYIIYQGFIMFNLKCWLKTGSERKYSVHWNTVINLFTSKVQYYFDS